MKKLLLLLFSISLLSSPSVFAKPMSTSDFVFTSVYECGQKRFDWYEVFDYEMSDFFFIHFDDNENVVISNDSIPYKSFEETIMPTMYSQNGWIHSLSFTESDGTYIFTLKSDARKWVDNDSDNYRAHILIFDKSNLTYISRYLFKNSQNEVVSSGESVTGVCFKLHLL